VVPCGSVEDVSVGVFASCLGKTIAPYIKETCMIPKRSAITDRPLYRFCIDWLLGFNYYSLSRNLD